MRKIITFCMTILFSIGIIFFPLPVKAKTQLATIERIEHIGGNRIYSGISQQYNVYSKGPEKVQYRVWLYYKQQSQWQELTQGYTSIQTTKKPFHLTLSSLEVGEYTLSVWIKAANKAPTNERGYDHYAYINFFCSYNDGQVYNTQQNKGEKDLSTSELPAITHVVSEHDAFREGRKENIYLTSKGFEEIQYRGWLYNEITNQWTDITQGYTPSTAAQSVNKITLPSLSAGKYTLSLWVKRTHKTPVNKKGFDSYIAFPITYLTEKSSPNSYILSTGKQSYAVGEKIVLESAPKEKVSYAFSIYDLLLNKDVTPLKNTSRVITWTSNKEGIYLLQGVQYTEQGMEIVNRLLVVGTPYKKSTGKIAYLTFDDGPSTQVTPRILKILDNYNIQATFFVIGQAVNAHPDLVKAAYNKGHVIANHSYTHEYKKIYGSPSALLAEIYQTNTLLKSILPAYDTKIFRFPGGSYGKKESFKMAVQNAGYDYYDWNALNGDADAYLVSADQLVANIKKTVKNQKEVIILMHDAPVKTTTADALPRIIEYLIQQGYEFRTLS